MRIPKILHGIWFGEELPEKFLKYRNSWKKHHPNWNFILWTEDNLFELRNQELFNNAKHEPEMSDIARLEILRRYGEVYADMDYSCEKSIKPLIYNTDFFIVQDLPTWQSKNPKYKIPYLNNALMGCTPNHPLINKLIIDLPQFYMKNKHRHVCFRTGPGYVSQILYNTDNITILDNQMLRNKYAVHHYSNSWKYTEPQGHNPWPED